MDTQEFKSKTQEAAKLLDDAGIRFSFIALGDEGMQLLNNIDNPAMLHAEAIGQLAIIKQIEAGKLKDV